MLIRSHVDTSSANGRRRPTSSRLSLAAESDLEIDVYTEAHDMAAQFPSCSGDQSNVTCQDSGMLQVTASMCSDDTSQSSVCSSV